MDLTRMGANRKEVRTTAFVDREPRISIDPKSGSIKLSVQYADGMGTQGQYDYTVTITPSDLTAILSAISVERTAFQPGELQTCLGVSAAILLRLLSAASALPFQLAPTDARLKFQAAKEKLAAKRASEA
ncbi:MAG: hypothetical protein RIQ60_3245 [Pseudomonadota bacterium]|jgi:hypothetical protein